MVGFFYWGICYYGFIANNKAGNKGGKDMKKTLKRIFSKGYIRYRIAKFKCRVCLWVLWILGQFDPEMMRDYHFWNYKFTHRR